MPSFTGEYGFTFWFRYTTLYPFLQTTGKSAAWYVMARMTINNPGKDLNVLGDRTLALWQGSTFYHFCTYDTITNNANLWANLNFVGDQEGQWNFVAFSYQAGASGAKGKTAAFLQ